MTPSHQADREVLLQALRSPATYIGCIGSRHKIAATNAYLMANGIPEADLARVHARSGWRSTARPRRRSPSPSPRR